MIKKKSFFPSFTILRFLCTAVCTDNCLSPNPCLMHDKADVNYLCCKACPLLSSILILSSQQVFISLPSTTHPLDLPRGGCFSLLGFSHQVLLRSAYQLLKENLSTFCTFSVFFCCLEWILEDCKKSLAWVSVYASIFRQGYTSTTGLAFTV